MPKIIIPEEERKAVRKFLNHATESGVIKFFIQQEQEILQRQLTVSEVVDLMKNRAVCPKCERIALREYNNPHSQKYECPYCGHVSDKFSVGQYIATGLYK